MSGTREYSDVPDRLAYVFQGSEHVSGHSSIDGVPITLKTRKQWKRFTRFVYTFRTIWRKYETGTAKVENERLRKEMRKAQGVATGAGNGGTGNSRAEHNIERTRRFWRADRPRIGHRRAASAGIIRQKCIRTTTHPPEWRSSSSAAPPATGTTASPPATPKKKQFFCLK